MVELLHNPWVSGILGGIISSVTAFFITRKYILKKEELKGRHLYQYPSFYPFKITSNNEIEIDREILLKSLKYFTNKRKDYLSAFELFSLVDQCKLLQKFNTEENKIYSKFLKKYSIIQLKKWSSEYNEILRPYEEITNSIGDTFKGLDIEFVFHRAINPIKSIAALKNTVFGREINGATTNFGFNLIKDYGILQDDINRRKSEVSYGVNLNGINLKSTTIPIFDKKYGLLGFLCLNIIISEEKYNGNLAVKKFFKSLFQIDKNKRIDEIILKPK